MQTIRRLLLCESVRTFTVAVAVIGALVGAYFARTVSSAAEKYPELPLKQQLKNAYPIWREEHKAVFKDFEAFWEAAGIK